MLVPSPGLRPLRAVVEGESMGEEGVRIGEGAEAEERKKGSQVSVNDLGLGCRQGRRCWANAGCVLSCSQIAKTFQSSPSDVDCWLGVGLVIARGFLSIFDECCGIGLAFGAAFALCRACACEFPLQSREAQVGSKFAGQPSFASPRLNPARNLTPWKVDALEGNRDSNSQRRIRIRQSAGGQIAK